MYDNVQHLNRPELEHLLAGHPAMPARIQSMILNGCQFTTIDGRRYKLRGSPPCPVDRAEPELVTAAAALPVARTTPAPKPAPIAHRPTVRHVEPYRPARRPSSLISTACKLMSGIAATRSLADSKNPKQ